MTAVLPPMSEPELADIAARLEITAATAYVADEDTVADVRRLLAEVRRLRADLEESTELLHTAESIARGRLTAVAMMDRATAEYRSTLDAGTTGETAQSGASGPGNPSWSTDRGTGERGPHGRSETADPLDDTTPWGSEPLTAGQIDAAKRALRPVHYREAANSLRGYAAARHVGDTYDSGHADGITAAADRIDSYARDLDEEAGR